MIDSWHLFRGGVTPDQLARTPGDRVFGVQINDGPAPTQVDPLREMTKGRMLPGEGVFDLIDMIRTLDGIGSRAPIAIEVFSDRLAALPPAEAAMQCAEATRAVLKDARGGNG
jgi:sugar phosphate isomerase/epimerase